MSKIGRPSLGVTKKVSITLPVVVWQYIDSFEQLSKSAYFRDLAIRDLPAKYLDGYEEFIRELEDREGV